MYQVIVALIKHQNRFQFVLDKLAQQQLDVCLFGSVSQLQKWLEINHEPIGLIIDFVDASFQNFLIRFSLRYPETPVFSLKAQSVQQLELRLMAFNKRILLPKNKSYLGHILLVDDSKTIQSQYKKLLERQGYQVDLADNAEQGYEQAMANHYDLTIIDYFMPGDTGAQLVAKLHANEQSEELVCAILTAQYKQQVVDECLKAGARECMFKNESFDLFLSRVSALIRGIQSKRQIERERNRLIGLLYSVAEGVYGVTADGRIQFVNPATLTLLGRSVVDLVGHFPHEVIHPVDSGGQKTSFEHCFLQQAYLYGDELKDWRTLFQRSDGSVFPVECSVMKLGNQAHNDGMVVVFRDISEQQRLEKNWQWRLNHDPLTGLLNRHAFEAILSREFIRLKRTRDSAILLFVDLDKFKIINDELGHAAGDQLLISLAEGLKSHAREYDQIGRLAGDEFVILMTHIQLDEISELAERYRRLLEQTNLLWQGKNYVVTGSIGVATLDQNVGSIGELMENADFACHQAKQKGRNQWALFKSENAQATEQGNWHKRLTSAMRYQKFSLLHQPVFDLAEPAKIIGTNCLLRLQEGNALISPLLFMSNAKRFGVIKEIDKMVINQLVKHRQQQHTFEASWYSVTLSVEAMSDSEFCEQLCQLWTSNDLSPNQLCFEVGEEELFNFPQWKDQLNNLKRAGFKVIVSHFGMNSQSLLNLPQWPVDLIKLDTSLTRDLVNSKPRCNLIDAIVKTAKQSDIQVIVTHIESAEELELVKARGVDLVQGFYLKQPEILR